MSRQRKMHPSIVEKQRYQKELRKIKAEYRIKHAPRWRQKRNDAHRDLFNAILYLSYNWRKSVGLAYSDAAQILSRCKS